MTHSRMTLAVVALILMAACAACGSSTSNADKTSTGVAKSGAQPTAKASTPSAGGGSQKQLTITAKDFSFSADDLNVSKGDTIAITFKNMGSATHALSFFSDDAYKNPIAGADAANVSAGGTKTLTVTADVGLYYRCNIHPTQMKGELEFSK